MLGRDPTCGIDDRGGVPNHRRASDRASIERKSRAADHATNIAERVIFILTGEDIRHAPRVRVRDLS